MFAKINIVHPTSTLYYSPNSLHFAKNGWAMGCPSGEHQNRFKEQSSTRLVKHPLELAPHRLLSDVAFLQHHQNSSQKSSTGTVAARAKLQVMDEAGTHNLPKDILCSFPNGSTWRKNSSKLMARPPPLKSFRNSWKIKL